MSVRPAASVRNRRRTACAFVAAVALVLPVSVSVLAGPADATSAGHTESAPVQYVVDQPVCPPPTRPGEVSCMAMRRVPAARSTPGAYPLTRAATTLGPSGGLTPALLAAGYRYDRSGGAGQTVAVIDWYDDPHAGRDLNAFDAHYGFPAETRATFRKVNQNGVAGHFPAARTATSVEITLDVQAVRSVCQRCRILLVEARRPQLADLSVAVRSAVRLGADEISNSYGSPETPGHPFGRSIRAGFHHPGVVVTASSGDDGWYGWDVANQGHRKTSRSSIYPGTDPQVVSVGGTRLNLTSTGARSSEVVWNENGVDDGFGYANKAAAGATGSGCSYSYPAPSWQQRLRDYPWSACHGRRVAADVSADADPATGLDIYNTYGHSGWETIGGTSLSAPLIAAMWALAGGAHHVKYPAQHLYENLVHRPSVLHDVKSGGSGFCAGDGTANCSAHVNSLTSGKTNNPSFLLGTRVDCSYGVTHRRVGSVSRRRDCNAATGYDGPTGVGSPDGLLAFHSTLPAVSVHAAGTPRLHRSSAFRVTVHRRITNSKIVGYTWYWGDGTKSHTSRATTNHIYHRRGSYSVRVLVRDSRNQQAVATRRIAVGTALHLPIHGPSKVHARRAYTFSAKGFADPNTGAKITSLTWFWRDGTKAGHGISLRHAWRKPGRYVVRLVGIDDTGVHTDQLHRVHVIR